MSELTRALVDAERELRQATEVRDQMMAEVEGMVRRLRRAISAGLVSEEAGQYIRSGAGDLAPEAREALVDQLPVVTQ